MTQEMHKKDQNSFFKKLITWLNGLLLLWLILVSWYWLYDYQLRKSNQWLWWNVQTVALTHCDVLYYDYQEFQDAVAADLDCRWSSWIPAQEAWLALSENERDQLSTRFETDWSLVVYDPRVEANIQEGKILVSIEESDDEKAAELAQNSIELIMQTYGDSVADIRFLFKETKLYYDYIVEYSWDKLNDGTYLDIAAFAELLDNDERFQDSLNEQLVFVNPNLVFPHEPLLEEDKQSQEDALNSFTTQSFEEEESYQWYLDHIWLDDTLSCLPSPRPIKIAVVDNWFDMKHPDLQDSIYKVYDEADRDNDVHIPKIETSWNHGTKEAWIIWASHNWFGIRWVMPEADLILVKSTRDSAHWRDITNGIEAIATAYELGADIINLSWWGYGKVPMLERVTKKVASEWTTLVAAAWNYNKSEEFYPAAYDWVIAVSAIDEENKKASFSNYGPWVDIAAPWVNMLTTDLDNTYNPYNGTSEASPTVAWWLGLAMSYWLSFQDILDHTWTLDDPSLGAWVLDLRFMCDMYQEKLSASSDVTSLISEDDHNSAELPETTQKVIKVDLLLLLAILVFSLLSSLVYYLETYRK